jgi:hypothetical protein
VAESSPAIPRPRQVPHVRRNDTYQIAARERRGPQRRVGLTHHGVTIQYLITLRCKVPYSSLIRPEPAYHSYTSASNCRYLREPRGHLNSYIMAIRGCRPRLQDNVADGAATMRDHRRC